MTAHCCIDDGSDDTTPALAKTNPPPGPPSNPQNLSALNIQALCLIGFLSELGTLIRMGLSALFEGPGQSVFPISWVQAMGCFAFGVFVHRRVEIEKWWPELYVGLRVGLAGSIATFATWELQSFEAFSDMENASRGWLHSATDGLSQIFITLAVVFFSLHFGRHVSAHFPHKHRFRPCPRWARWTIAATCVLGYIVTLIIFLTTSSTTWRVGRRVTWALVLAPFGSIIRWIAGFKINPISPSWIKLGTFGSNMTSTSLLAMAYLLQRVVPLNEQLTVWQCTSLQGIQDGFCGCLSTIPAWIEQAERMHELDRKRSVVLAWFYIFFMYICGLICVILVLGIGKWASPQGIASTCVY